MKSKICRDKKKNSYPCDLTKYPHQEDVWNGDIVPRVPNLGTDESGWLFSHAGDITVK
jgi:hypothetical protein